MDEFGDTADELINPWYGDRYFSAGGGLAESRHVFLAGNGLPGRWRDGVDFHIAETGLGTGLNLLAAADCLAASGRRLRLHWWSVELHPLGGADLRACLAAFPELSRLAAAHAARWDLPPGPGWLHYDLDLAPAPAAVSVHVRVGDVAEFMAELPAALAAVAGEGAAVDAWALDGHSPTLNPDMWSPAVFTGMARSSRGGADPSTAATYTAAGTVKRGLRAAGFAVRRSPGHGAKRHMVRAEYRPLSPPAG